MLASPLWLENFLLDYHMGHAAIVAFVLSLAAVAPLKSKRIFTLMLFTFGIVFFLLPAQVVPGVYRLFGIALVAITPIVWTIAD